MSSPRTHLCTLRGVNDRKIHSLPPLVLGWEHEHCRFTFINERPGWSVFYQEKKVEEMIEWGVFSKRPFCSQQALAEKSLVSKRFSSEGLSGQDGFFSWAKELLKCRWPYFSFLLAEFSDLSEEWHLSVAKCVGKNLTTSCYLLIYHHSVTVLLCSFYRARLYMSVWLLGHPVERTEKHWMKQCRMRGTELIVFSNIGDHWHHQVTNVK